MESKVSFLIPSFNHEKYIYETLNSIRDDLYPNKEIILIDDGSKDSTVEVVKKWMDDNPTSDLQLLEQENKGVVFTLNRLVSLSTGKYIRIFSSDDLNIADSTLEMVKLLNDSPGFEAVFADAVVIDEQGKKLAGSAIQFQKKNRDLYLQDLGRALIREWGVSGPCILYSRQSYFEVLGGYPEDLKIEDWYSYLKYYSKGKLKFLDGAVCYYRVHTENTSRTTKRDLRIANQMSHKATLVKVQEFFSGVEKLLLFSEEFLVSCKLCFLRGQFIRAGAYFLTHLLFEAGISIRYYILK